MADEVTIATDSARAVEGIVPAQHRWLFTRKGEKGAAPPRAPPQKK